VSAHWRPSQAYLDYCSDMKRYGHVRGEDTMSNAYKCDRCGTFHDDCPVTVTWHIPHVPAWPEIHLCAVCAPITLEALEAIAVTRHRDQTGAYPIEGTDGA
jgi:hypothetical protein